jgi:hypothetical protein
MQVSVKRLLMMSFLLCLYACTSSPKEDVKVLNYKQSDKDYYALVDKIRNSKAQASDYDMLIRVFPLTSLYTPKSNQEQAAKLLSQSYMERQLWSECLQTNEKLLSMNYTSLTGHYGVSICATEIGNVELGKFHNAILDNFIEAIWRTGTGQSPDSPFLITSVNDLYAFIQLHQLIAVGQSLTYVGNLPIQSIRVQNPETNRSFTWYFNVSPQFRRGVIDEIEGL